MGLLDWISPGLNAATTVANTVSDRKAKNKADQFAMAMQQVQLERQAKQDAVREALQSAQIRNYDADNVRADAAARASEADRKAAAEARDLSLGIEAAHIEPGEDLGARDLGKGAVLPALSGALSQTPSESPPPMLPGVQPGLPSEGVAGQTSILTPMAEVFKARQPAPVMMRPQDKQIPRRYNPDLDPRLEAIHERGAETGANQAAAADARATEAEKNRKAKAAEGALARLNRKEVVAMQENGKRALAAEYGSRVVTQGQRVAAIAAQQRMYLKSAADAGKDLSVDDAHKMATTVVNEMLGADQPADGEPLPRGADGADALIAAGKATLEQALASPNLSDAAKAELRRRHKVP